MMSQTRPLLAVLFCALAYADDMGEGLAGLAGLFGQMNGGGGPGGGGPGGQKGKPGPGKSGCLAGKFPGPTAKPYIYTANGCGPQGMQVKENFGLHVCCNNHDLCYGVCGTTFSYCEAQFGKCMKAVCEKHGGEKTSECNQQAQSFTGMTRMFGGGMHQSVRVLRPVYQH
jgi:hypothetical protein